MDALNLDNQPSVEELLSEREILMCRLDLALAIIEGEYPDGDENKEFAVKTRKEFASDLWRG